MFHHCDTMITDLENKASGWTTSVGQIYTTMKQQLIQHVIGLDLSINFQWDLTE